MTRPSSAYFSYQAFRYGMVLIQLMQLYVQKSTRTTLPFRSARVIGSVLINPEILANSGASLNCDLSIWTIAVVPFSEMVAGTKLFCCPEAALLRAGLLK